MAKSSAGLLVFRYRHDRLEVLLVHPGGPYFTRKDDGIWSIPKGEYEANDDPLKVAFRELEEETGNILEAHQLVELKPVYTKAGKGVQAWAVKADFAKPFISSNTFPLEWPPRSGKIQEFPETDKAEYFDLDEARKKIYPYQLPLLDQAEQLLQKG